jgi:phosphoribosylformimino-5-aminoimidazole carboxamide ribotide isomerase
VDLYPAIDLRGGCCVRLAQGDFDRETVYRDDPVAQACAFADAGAPWLHVVDLDAARRQGSNRDVVTAIANAVDIPVQTSGGVRDAALLAVGATRVVIGSAALDEPDLVRQLAAEHPGGVAIGLDHWSGEVRVRGWQEGSGRRLMDMVDEFADAGAAAFVVTDISRDGMLIGPDLDGMAALVERTTIPVVASGGVESTGDLRALRDTGVVGVIVGRAIYEQRFTIEEALAACEA